MMRTRWGVLLVLFFVACNSKSSSTDIDASAGGEGGSSGGTATGGAGGTTQDGGSGGAAAAGGVGGSAGGSGGACANPATPTLSDLQTARDQLESGALDVALNSDGCVRVHQTLDAQSNQLTEELLIDGKVIERQDRSNLPAEFKVWVDEDGDGVWDWDHVATKGATITDEQVVEQTYINGVAVERITMIRTSDTDVSVSVEGDDGSGNLTVKREFTGHVWSSAAPIVNGPTPGTNSGDCDAAQATALTKTMKDAISKGVECMKGLVPYDAFRIARAASRGINLSCGTLNPGELARNDLWALMFGGKVSEITVDPAQFFPYGNNENLLFHELLHSVFGAHPDDIAGGGDPKIAELIQVRDRTYACAATCFGPMPTGTATKCHCAACIKGNKCDSRCKGYSDCSDKWPSQCTCAAKSSNTYDSLLSCLVDCPGGLSCFSCVWCCTDPVDLSCPTE